MKRIAVFASGTGTNARNLIEYFEPHHNAQVTLLVCNNPQAGVISIAKEHGVEVLLTDREQFFSEHSIVPQLKERGIDLIVLAGFLWLIPPAVISAFPGKIVNIHPALLPKFGGKGMYGKKVHEAVLASGEKVTGVTIHFVNEKFDDGKHIAQFTCPVLPGDTPETLSARVQQLEHAHFAETIDRNVIRLL
ncbi:MAG TPA: phosphoribosylglycinamide formyltransferase [Bacteroidia bacterium]|nr:phosphoribosylglycinamide formyltransferase [Bacteroidia bacterium]